MSGECDKKSEQLGCTNSTGQYTGGVPGGDVPAQSGSVQGSCAGGGGGAVELRAGGNGECAAERGKENGITKVGKRNLASVYVQVSEEERKAGLKSGIVSFSEQESAVLRAFLRTTDYEKTAAELQIKVDSVKRILRRPNLKLFLRGMIEKAAAKELMDEPWVLKELLGVWEEKRVPSDKAMDALKTIAKMLTPKGAGVTVNVQQNSIYGNMGRGAIDAEWDDARAAAADGV